MSSSDTLKAAHRNISAAIEAMADLSHEHHYHNVWNELHAISDLLLDAQQRLGKLMTGRVEPEKPK